MSIMQISLLIGLGICTVVHTISDEGSRSDFEKGFFGTYSTVFAVALTMF